VGSGADGGAQPLEFAKKDGGATALFVAALERELWEYLASAPRDDLELFRLSLTVPEGSGEGLVFDAARVVAAEAARFDGSGTLLVLDISPVGAPHLFGVLLSTAERKDCLLRLWREKTRADRKSVRWQRVVGQGGKWDRRTNPTLREHLHRVVRYTVKRLPAPFWRPMTERLAAASGPFAKIWQAVLEQLPTAALETPDSSTDALVTSRVCKSCGRSIEPGRRRDTQHCKPACRTRTWRRCKASSVAKLRPAIAKAISTAKNVRELCCAVRAAAPATDGDALVSAIDELRRAGHAPRFIRNANREWMQTYLLRSVASFCRRAGLEPPLDPGGRP